jgi:hypothetical protein
MLLICGGLFFAAPHHRRRENSFQPCTLGGIYGDFVSSIPELQTPRIGMILFLGLAGIVAAFYPVLLVVLVRWKSDAGAIFVLCGIVALLGAAVNFIAMLVSHMSIGFGSSSSSGDETWFIVIIPLVQAAFAVVSIVIGVSGACAGWASRIVGP